MPRKIEIEVFEFVEKFPPLNTDIQVYDIRRKRWLSTSAYRTESGLHYTGFFISQEDLSHWYESPKL